MNKFAGKKTYAAVIVGLAYLIGGKAGFWTIDGELLAGIGLAAAAFIRAAIASTPPPQ